MARSKRPNDLTLMFQGEFSKVLGSLTLSYQVNNTISRDGLIWGKQIEENFNIPRKDQVDIKKYFGAGASTNGDSLYYEKVDVESLKSILKFYSNGVGIEGIKSIVEINNSNLLKSPGEMAEEKKQRLGQFSRFLDEKSEQVFSEERYRKEISAKQVLDDLQITQKQFLEITRLCKVYVVEVFNKEKRQFDYFISLRDKELLSKVLELSKKTNKEQLNQEIEKHFTAEEEAIKTKILRSNLESCVQELYSRIQKCEDFLHGDGPKDMAKPSHAQIKAEKMRLNFCKYMVKNYLELQNPVINGTVQDFDTLLEENVNFKGLINNVSQKVSKVEKNLGIDSLTA